MTDKPRTEKQERAAEALRAIAANFEAMRPEVLLARAEAAEKERAEALDSVVLYVNERDEALRVLRIHGAEEWIGWERTYRDAEARANNLAPYVKRSQAAEARCATLEAALREIGYGRDEGWPATRAQEIARDALAAATPPADTNAAVTQSESRADVACARCGSRPSVETRSLRYGDPWCNVCWDRPLTPPAEKEGT